MEEATGAESLLGKIKPPRLEDAGLEDCALPPESIREAFLKAASAVRSLVSASDGEDGFDDRSCVEDPWEDASDALIGVKEGVTGPSEGCATEKGGGLTEAPGDEVYVGGDGTESKADTVVGPGPADGGAACVDGLQGLEIGEKDGINLGKKSEDVAEDEGKGKKEQPSLRQGYV